MVKTTEEELFIRRFMERHSGLSPEKETVFGLYREVVVGFSATIRFIREMKSDRIRFYHPADSVFPSLAFVLDPNGIFCMVDEHVVATVLFENNDIPTAKEFSALVRNKFFN
ncbi:MAG TPA: hypothetical protein DCX32_02340 [Candidatus Moranbacteria bacterium]|nr:hypothetical protein [Candidatus Moranbacteria bacterium]